MSEEIGHYLRQARESIGLSLDQLQEKTKIQKPFLIAIENGDFDKLPSPFYVRTYLRSYANQVKVEPHHILRHYRKEEQAVRYGVQQNTAVMPAVGQQTGHFSLSQTTIQKPASSNRIKVHTALTIAKPSANTQVNTPPVMERMAQTQKLRAVDQSQSMPTMTPPFEPGKTQTMPPFNPAQTQRLKAIENSGVNRRPSRTVREQSMTIAKDHKDRSEETIQKTLTEAPSANTQIGLAGQETVPFEMIKGQDHQPGAMNLSSTMPGSGSKKMDSPSRVETRRDPRFERTARFDDSKLDVSRKLETGLVPLSDTIMTRREKFSSPRDEKQDSRYSQDVESLKTLSRSAMKTGRSKSKWKVDLFPVNGYWIAGAIGLLVLIIGVLIYVFSGGDDAKKTNTSKPTTPEQAAKPESEAKESTPSTQPVTESGPVEIEKSGAGIYHVSKGNQVKLSFKLKQGTSTSGQIVLKDAAGKEIKPAFVLSTKYPTAPDILYTFSGDANKLTISIAKPEDVEIMANGNISINKVNPVKELTFLVKE
ncbi:RodZ family helix-turn-helix domain-containing protein [Thermoactinomyces sp. DSM 45892]|uniref:helix-turn-helix domain-containing protein n=1 Tax=Thermoactinomyces sp. DSM 45892 TaxID=1882753 RepID=UPI0008959185|nr:helix-turn-helix transcriptional regulator [Thermoactinomyces sp. DSM 45892]SDY48909.1 Helix-turn-helix domain-containing protein [Thermoactinomyces sp. DSM 45892]